jgi:hypothetical protein
VGAGIDDWFGYSLAAAGDATGDGRDDLLVGAPGVTRGGPDTGAAYLFRGQMAGSMTAAGAHAILRGVFTNDWAGASLGAGDLDGDGISDLAIGAWGSDSSADGGGAVFVVYGPVNHDVNLENAPTIITGAEVGDAFGFSTAIVADINGDGLADLLVGAVGQDGGGPDSGAAYLFYGPVDREGSADDAAVRLIGEVYDDRAGSSVTSAGDTDGDGYGDLLIGAPGHDRGGTDSGTAYIICGRGY